MTYQTGFRIRTSGWPQATGPAPRIAQARVERPAYDQDGNHRPAIFMDYLLPTTCDIPRIVTAIEDALALFGVRIYEQHPRSARILELIALAREGYRSQIAVADAQTMRDQTVLFVDFNELNGQVGRTFRSIPPSVEPIVANLSLANMDFAEFADNTNPDGIFCGF